MIDQEQYAAELEQIILPYIQPCADEGYMEPAAQDYRGMPLRELHHEGTLHYVCYDARKFQKLGVPGASQTFHGAIVISHGFSEFTRKYQELVWYFLLAGFSVCIMEHRGHGYSARDVSDKEVIWIDDWRRYVADLAKFASSVGRLYADDHALNLFAHSMGGGIAAAMMQWYPNLIDKAILSSPMIAPKTGVPNWVAAGVCGACSDLGSSKKPALGQKPFSVTLDMSHYPGGSEARVQWCLDMRIADEHYQTCRASNGWVRQAVRLSHALLQPNMVERVETPIMLFQAGKDSWVRNDKQDEFVKMLHTAGAEIHKIVLEESCHEIFGMPNRVMAPYLKRILKFMVPGEKVSVLA